MWRILISLLLMGLAETGWSDSYTKIYSSGSWSLYRGAEMTVTAPRNRGTITRDMCLAAYVSDNASLKFAMASADQVELDPSLRDHVWVQASSEVWNFRKRQASAGLSVEVSSYTERRAIYDGHAITFGVPDFKPGFGIFLMFAGVRESIDVIDSRGNVIAKFPANGFAEVRDRLFSCAGA